MFSYTSTSVWILDLNLAKLIHGCTDHIYETVIIGWVNHFYYTVQSLNA